MRSILKSVAEKSLVGCGFAAIARRVNRDRSVVLAYHNIVPEGDVPCGDRSLHLPQEVFKRQLDVLARTHDVVPLSSLLSRTSAEDSPGSSPRAAITFDDAYRGALTAGLDELRSRSLPATIFATPDHLGREAFWWDLIGSEPSGSVGEAIRRHALSVLRGKQADILRWARIEGLLQRRSLPEHARPATLDLIRSISAEADVTLASHTWSHPNLAALTPDEVESELVRPVDWFHTHDLPIERWLAYPYGSHSPSVQDQTREVYTVAFTTQAGFASQRGEDIPNRMRVPRLNVPAGVSLERFELLASGALYLLSGSETSISAGPAANDPVRATGR